MRPVRAGAPDRYIRIRHVVKVNALDHLVINVSDLGVHLWYRKILGMESGCSIRPGSTPRTSLVFGNQKINVRPRNADKVEWFTADHETAGATICAS